MFNQDLPFGLEAENKVADWLRLIGFNVVQSVGKDKEKDMAVSSLIEVKHDRKATSTGNFAIEVKCRGQLSGLSTTKSDMWALCTEEGCWLAKTSVLKNWVKTYCQREDGTWNLVKGGDGKLSDLALISYDFIKNFYKLI